MSNINSLIASTVKLSGDNYYDWKYSMQIVTDGRVPSHMTAHDRSHVPRHMFNHVTLSLISYLSFAYYTAPLTLLRQSVSIPLVSIMFHTLSHHPILVLYKPGLVALVR